MMLPLRRRRRDDRNGAAWVAAAMAATVAMIATTQRVAGERHVAAASGHICVIQDGGAVGCYGTPTTNGKLSPPAGVAFHAVTVGNDFSCGLTAANSSLRCWGALPGGTVQLPPASQFFVDVHAGPRHVCGLVPNGTVYCYGNNASLGAINVPPGVVFQGVSAGTDYTCGVARKHTVVCWGNATNPVVAAKATWKSITDAEHVAAGADHACYVRVNGSVACWGRTSRGGATPPAALMSNGSVWWLAAGGGMTCAMSGSSVPGPVTCWGAVNGTIAAIGYEVACAGWGCIASVVSSPECGGKSNRECALGFAATGGTTLPQGVGMKGGNAAVVVTLAGTNNADFADGVGTLARFKYPRGVSLDNSGGKLFVADSINHVIRRVDIATRAVTTVAGIAGTSGRAVGNTPLQSTFNTPSGVEVDDAGSVYVADTNNHAIRKLSGAWVAGNKGGDSGSNDNQAGSNAKFKGPYAVAAGGILLYVADTFNNAVRTVSASGNHAVDTLVTYATNVRYVALNTAAKKLYVACNFAVYVVTYAGVSTLLAGKATDNDYDDGTGADARFNYVYGMALDVDTGVLYAADYGNHRIRRITTDSGVVTTLAGSSIGYKNGAGTSAQFRNPWGIALDATNGILYIGDQNNHAIRQVRQPSDTVGLVAVPLPPSPLAPTHQLTAWRALGIKSTIATAQPVLDARSVTFPAPLSAVNTAGLNPVISTLLLSIVPLAPRDAPPTAARPAI